MSIRKALTIQGMIILWAIFFTSISYGSEAKNRANIVFNKLNVRTKYSDIEQRPHIVKKISFLHDSVHYPYIWGIAGFTIFLSSLCFVMNRKEF